jgi:hypothetical protein
MKTHFTDDDDNASNVNNNMHGLKKDIKAVMITNMIPFHCDVPVHHHD